MTIISNIRCSKTAKLKAISIPKPENIRQFQENMGGNANRPNLRDFTPQGVKDVHWCKVYVREIYFAGETESVGKNLVM